MSCKIIYNNQNYTIESFKDFLVKNKNLFLQDFISQDIEGFKEFVSGKSEVTELEEVGFNFTQPTTVTTQAPVSAKTETAKNTIEYIPKGKQRQTYTIVGNKIYNKEGVEVFKEDSVDRNKIFANFAVQQGRAVVVTYRDNTYVVNDKDQIISGRTGKIMQWINESGDRKAIIQLANEKRTTQTRKQTMTDAEIAATPKFREEFNKELEKNPNASVKDFLEYYKKCLM